MKNSSDTIGNRTRDLPACSAVPLWQGMHVPRTPCVVSFPVEVTEEDIWTLSVRMKLNEEKERNLHSLQYDRVT
jgi:hypothetical protein